MIILIVSQNFPESYWRREHYKLISIKIVKVIVDVSIRHRFSVSFACFIPRKLSITVENVFICHFSFFSPCEFIFWKIHLDAHWFSDDRREKRCFSLSMRSVKRFSPTSADRDRIFIDHLFNKIWRRIRSAKPRKSVVVRRTKS